MGVGWVSIPKCAQLRQVLGIPPHVLPVAYLCIGNPETFPEKPMLQTENWWQRLPLTVLVYQDRWGGGSQVPFMVGNPDDGSIGSEFVPQPFQRPAEPAASPAGLPVRHPALIVQVQLGLLAPGQRPRQRGRNAWTCSSNAASAAMRSSSTSMVMSHSWPPAPAPGR